MSVLTVGGVAWANGSGEHDSGSQKRDCPNTRPHSGWTHHGTAGRVTSVSSSSLTLVGRDGKPQTIRTGAGTRVYTGRAEAQLSDIKAGWLAFVELGSDGVATVIRAIDADQIREHAGDRSHFRHDFTHHRFAMPHNVAAGRITAVTGSSITLASRDGATTEIAVNASTRVFTRAGQIELASLKQGWLAFAIRGKNGVAVVIRAADPSQFGGHGDHAGAETTTSLEVL